MTGFAAPRDCISRYQRYDLSKIAQTSERITSYFSFSNIYFSTDTDRQCNCLTPCCTCACGVITDSQPLFSCGDGDGQHYFCAKNIVSCSLWQFIEACKCCLSCLKATTTQVAPPCKQDNSERREGYRVLTRG